MKSILNPKNLALLLLFLGTACASAGSGPQNHRKRPVLEKRKLSKQVEKGLIEVEQAFLREDPRFPAQKAELLQAHPEAGPWLAKAFITHAVLGHDALLARGFFPEALILEGRFGGKLEHSLFARARVALVSLGRTGAHSICVYLLRDTKGPNRLVGRLLLLAFSERILYPELEREFAEGLRISQREILHLLGDLPPDPRAVAMLEKASQSPHWDLRGASLVALAKQWKKGGYRGGGERLQKILESDSDPFVQRKAVEALAILGERAAAPAILGVLERGLKERNELLVEAAVEALTKLTGRHFGSKVGAWKTWFQGRGK
jgi:hypothetical protein